MLRRQGCCARRLELWQGPLCSGLRSPLLDAERDRLHEKRIGVHEDRIELDLIVGTERDLVDELRRLVSEHPFRERLWGLLMLALYRLGQPADALAAYQSARRTLQVELGIEPSSSLQRLQQQILTRDPALLGSSTRCSHDARRTPRTGGHSLAGPVAARANRLRRPGG